MKKRRKGILAVVMVVSMLILAACGSKKEESNTLTNKPTATETPTSTPTEAPTSTPTEMPTPTPTEPPHEHAYTESTSKEATCTEAGEKTFTCDCGDTYTEVIEATGHKYGDYVYNKDATYKADGTETATCVCGLNDTRTASGTKLEYTYTDLTKTMYAKAAVNVRNLPSTDGEKLGGLAKGQEVVVTGQCNETGWYRISYNGGTGYVSSSYLQNDKPVTETPTPTPSPEPTPETPSNPLDITNTTTSENWRIREDGVYVSDASTNIVADWSGQTLAEYCAARDIVGLTFTDPWYGTVFMRTSRWGDYVIGSRMLLSITHEGQEVWIKAPF